MKIAVLGTGMVGQGLAARLAGLGHDVVIGTRDPAKTLARTEPDGLGNPPFAVWQESNPEVGLVAFPEAGEHAEVVLNATRGAVALEALEAVGAAHLAGKVLADLALPLDLSNGMPPKVLVAADDSLGEQIQRAFPDTRVVKTLNTMFFPVMIDPSRVPGEHVVFVAGEDDDAKTTVGELLRQFGWPAESVIDLGGIRGARGTEGYMQLYFTLQRALGTFDFNIDIVRVK
jgi:8-hydroxy-5-deazaflavin:NADPH oxidoreductase